MTALDITGGRVLDPGRGIDAAATVSVAGGVITGVTPAADAGRIATGKMNNMSKKFNRTWSFP